MPGPPALKQVSSRKKPSSKEKHFKQKDGKSYTEDPFHGEECHATSDEEPETRDVARSKLKEEHVHFGKCLLVAIRKNFHVIVEFQECDSGMTGLLAKYTPAVLKPRGILWAFARKGKNALGYQSSSTLRRGMEVRAFFSISQMRKKAHIRYAGISGSDANTEMERCARRLAEKHNQTHLAFDNLANELQVRDTGFDDVPRFFTVREGFSKKEKKQFKENGNQSGGIQTINQIYLPVNMQSSTYIDYYFEHKTGSDYKGQKEPCLYEYEARVLADAIIEAEKQDPLNVSTEDFVFRATTGGTATPSKNSSSGSPSKSALSERNAQFSPMTAVGLQNPAASYQKSSDEDEFGEMDSADDMENSICALPVEDDTEFPADLNDMLQTDKSLLDPVKLDDSGNSHSAPTSPVPKEDQTGDSSTSGVGVGDGTNPSGSTSSIPQGKSTKKRGIQCNLGSETDMKGEDWEMAIDPYNVRSAAPLLDLTLDERKSKLQFYKDKRNHYHQKYTEFKMLLEVTFPKTVRKNTAKKVPPSEINFSFLAKNILGRPDERNYASLNSKNRVYIQRKTYSQIMNGTHRFCSTPQAVYKGIFWHKLLTVPNRQKLATEKKTGQGFAHIFEDIFKDVWDVATERTRRGEREGSVWHIGNFPTKEVRLEIFRKEQTGFTSRISRLKAMDRKAQMQRQVNSAGDLSDDDMGGNSDCEME